MGPQPHSPYSYEDDDDPGFDEIQGQQVEEGGRDDEIEELTDVDDSEDDRVGRDHKRSEGEAEHAEERDAWHGSSSTLSLIHKWSCRTWKAILGLLGIRPRKQFCAGFPRTK